MIENIVSMLSKALTTQGVQSTSVVTRKSANNPFGNPFVSSNSANFSQTYAQNKPVKGGYFAGYYNNRPNIVGQRLFVEA